jgi:DNA-binding NarL/FixJ family response regulator
VPLARIAGKVTVAAANECRRDSARRKGSACRQVSQPATPRWSTAGVGERERPAPSPTGLARVSTCAPPRVFRGTSLPVEQVAVSAGAGRREAMSGAGYGARPITVVVGRFEPSAPRGLANALGGNHGVRILATDLQDAAVEHAVKRSTPSLVILPESVEHALLVRLKLHQPAVAILVLARNPSLLLRTALDHAGVSCLAHSASANEIEAAVRLAVRDSGKHLSDEHRRVARTTALGTGFLTESELDSLTVREIEVIRHVVQGLSYAEIALALAIKPETVRKHTASIRRKLGRGRQELIGIELPS